ncbi:MAG: hypothetical protein ACHQQQ_04255 [Bacteroidota bacterium]
MKSVTAQAAEGPAFLSVIISVGFCTAILLYRDCLNTQQSWSFVVHNPGDAKHASRVVQNARKCNVRLARPVGHFYKPDKLVTL